MTPEMDFAVRAVDVSKQYELYNRPVDRLIEFVTRRPRHTVFPALQEVTFEAERGETVGIIGQNGAGKSTLLKLLCRVTKQTSGLLETRGTIASILELGTGFHPEFSGRDNAALNAAILGLPAAEVKKRLPAIIEFSELGTFIDRPVKTYSSGMYMRLAFSVAVNVDPDILVIDEALAVGDGHFQKKCVDRIRDFQKNGKTILFCSHAMYLVSSICRRTLWLDHGRVMRWGPTLDVVHDYDTFLLQRDREHPSEGEPEHEQEASPARLREVTICDANGNPRQVFSRGDDVRVKLRIESESPSLAIHALVCCARSADDCNCFSAGTQTDGLQPLCGETEYELMIDFRNVRLKRGDYSIIAFVGDENALAVFDRVDVRPAFSMSGDKFEAGLISVDHRWTAEHEPAGAAR